MSLGVKAQWGYLWDHLWGVLASCVCVMVCTSNWSGAVASKACMCVQVTATGETGIQRPATGQTGGLSPAGVGIHLVPINLSCE